MRVGGILDLEANGPKKNYPGELTSYVKFTCILASMGGLLFGYDIGISGGVSTMAPFLQKFFPSVYHNQFLDTSNNTNFNHSFTLSMFNSSLYFTALFTSFLTKSFPRKFSMFSGAFLFFVGSVLNSAAINLLMLILGRICLGFGLGFSIQSIPLYISEMAPSKYRGSFNAFFQLSITIGILVANLVNYLTNNLIHRGWGWRVSLGGAAVPALFITISTLLLYDTPTSLLERGEIKKARSVLQRVRAVPENQVNAEFEDMVAAKAQTNPWKTLFETQYRPQLIMSILIPFFQQFTGINMYLFYAPMLLKTIGLDHNASLLSSLIISGINVFATLISVFGIFKWKRRTLFMNGGYNMLIFQIGVTYFTAVTRALLGLGDRSMCFPITMVICICCYVQGFAWSWGPLGWVVPSEIFPIEIRSAAQSVTTLVNMLFTFFLIQILPIMLSHMKFGIFIFFIFFVVLMTLFINNFLPETKDVPIEDMPSIWREHWYWYGCRFMTR